MIEQSVLNLGLHELLNAVKEISSFNISSTRGPFKKAFEGTYAIGGKDITIQLALPVRFPIEKPMLFLKDPQVLGFLPHIEKDGFICYSHDEGLLLDSSNPSGILKEAFQRAERTLRDGITGINKRDYLVDFEVLWSRQSEVMRIDSLFSPGNTFERILVFFDENTGKTVIVKNTDNATAQSLKTLYKCDVVKEFTSYRGIHIPLRDGAQVKPPSYWDFWNIKQLRKIVNENISSGTKKNLKSYLEKTKFKTQDKEYIFISIPIEKGQRAFVGILLTDFKRIRHIKTSYPFSHPLKQIHATFSVTPLSVKRHDTEFLLNRTLGHNKLIGKKVTLIGLGSIGSRIALELGRAGVSFIKLIDKEILDVDNIYRHELGTSSLYWKAEKAYNNISKAEGLKIELLQHFPSLNINYEMEEVLTLMEEQKNFILDSDIIIVALGSPTVELELNKRFYNMDCAPPIIYTWLDPLGLGGHTLLTNNQKKEGCFQCLYTHVENNNILIPNRASFAAPDQFFGKTLTGCESVFTPYGSLDALQTAILASRLAIKTLQGQERGNPLLSWKGEDKEVLSQGKKVSDRYKLTNEQLFEYRYLYRAENCPVCGTGETT
ncbi:E2/UBC family protein [Peribacillus deserti]|uniref:Thiamine biosynthesis protein ThiF n=1 Tax=Peribacillus deserti TaxID=673318 RepID=A0A2N5M4J7_9BACI|nr:E2/UBC family protein [Peribacillus deserti]PLT29291.1 thiamine biosynthesis protein ThiF [Peribacillus deserti]